jgi:hypothetical protein
MGLFVIEITAHKHKEVMCVFNVLNSGLCPFVLMALKREKVC